jgi:CubicO group peptidase (beta-lactamase class C family)
MANRIQLPRSAPEAQGIPSLAILSFIEEIESSVPELHSMMLLRHGTVVAEGWVAPYAPQMPHMLFSLSKSFTSTAIGMAVAEGRLKVDDLVLSFFPDEAPAEPDDHLKAMRVRHLLTMSTGHDQDTLQRTSSNHNWVRSFLSLPVEHEPGTHFVYNTAATYMLSAILQKLTGEKLVDYLRPRLFQPLGITGATWESCPLGINIGGYGLSIKTEDIARFGQLYLNQGKWNGKQLLSPAWVEEATSKQVSNGSNPDSDWNQGYGYQFWRCRHNIYRGDGAFGQYCIVMPEQDAVLAITSAVNDMQAVMNKVWECLLPAMSPAPLRANPGAQAELARRLASLRFDPPAGEALSPLAERVSGRKIVFPKNPLNLNSAVFDFGAQGVHFTFRLGRRSHSFDLGLGTWQFGKSKMMSRWPMGVAGSGVWTAPDTFQVTLRHYESPFYQTITCQFSQEGAVIDSNMNVGFGPKDSARLEGKF